MEILDAMVEALRMVLPMFKKMALLLRQTIRLKPKIKHATQLQLLRR